MAVEPRFRRINLYDEDGNPYTITNRLPVDADLTVSDIEIGAVEIKDGETDVRQKVSTDHLTTSKDERDNAACVASGNYGFKADEAVGSKMTPLITDEDDGAVAAGQTPQVVIGEMHYFDWKSMDWRRWEGESGYVYTYVTNFPETDYRDDGLFTVGTNRGVAIGGVATSDSVNPNDFGVFRITTDRSLVVTNDNITDGTQQTKITDGTNIAEVNSSGQLHTVMRGKCDDGNSTITPLPADTGGSDHIFIGEPIDTLDYSAVSIVVYSDVASATDGLEVEYSNDSTEWHSGEKYTIKAGSTKFFTPTLQAKYMRVTYTNGIVAQTEFHMHTVLRKNTIKWSSHNISESITSEDDAELVKSVLTGLNPDDVFTNVETTYHNSLKTSLIDGETGSRAEVEPLGALKVESPVRLVGTTFSNGTKDPNFWTDNSTLSGTVTQSGQILLSTGTTANATAVYTTVRKARKITGTTNQFRCIAGLTTDPQANNIRRIGAYTTNDGFFFQANGTTMQVGSRKASSDTLVSSGSFNGNYGDSWSPETNVLYRMIIEYTASSARFFVNGKLLHTIFNTTIGTTNTLTLPCTMENINSGGNTTNNTFVVQFCTILRLGNLITNGKYYHAGTTATTILKYGAGVLQRVTITDNTGDMLIYDGLSAAGTLIANIDASKTVGTMEFNAPFSDGLTIVTTGPPKMTIIYE